MIRALTAAKTACTRVEGEPGTASARWNMNAVSATPLTAKAANATTVAETTTVASDTPQGEDAGGEGREQRELRHVDGRTQVRRQDVARPRPRGSKKPFAGIPSNSPSAGEGKNLRTITPNIARSIALAAVRAPPPVRFSAKRRATSRGDPTVR